MDAEIDEIRQTVENIWRWVTEHQAPIEYTALMGEVRLIVSRSQDIVNLTKPLAEKTDQERLTKAGTAHCIALALLQRATNLEHILKQADIKGKDVTHGG